MTADTFLILCASGLISKMGLRQPLPRNTRAGYMTHTRKTAPATRAALSDAGLSMWLPLKNGGDRGGPEAPPHYLPRSRGLSRRHRDATPSAGMPATPSDARKPRPREAPVARLSLLSPRGPGQPTAFLPPHTRYTLERHTMNRVAPGSLRWDPRSHAIEDAWLSDGSIGARSLADHRSAGRQARRVGSATCAGSRLQAGRVPIPIALRPCPLRP